MVAKRLSFGFSSVTNIMNLSTGVGEDAHVRLTYTRSSDCAGAGGSATYSQDVTIAPRTNYQINMKWSTEPIGIGTSMPDGWCGSLVVTTTPSYTARPLIAYVQLVNQNNSNGDQYMAHQAFILPETP